MESDMTKLLDFAGDVLAKDSAVYVLCVSSMMVLAAVGANVAGFIA
jgi:hypothetical protein